MHPLKALYRELTQRPWSLALARGVAADVVAGRPLQWRRVRAEKGRWWADPFILRADEQCVVLLVEEYYEPICRGRLALLEVDAQTMQLRRSVPLLTLDTHLSYPFIWRHNGHVYVVPENEESGRLRVYELVGERLCERAVWLEESVADATLIDDFTMLATRLSDGYNGHRLAVYARPSVGASFTYAGTMALSKGNARMAGACFCCEGKLIRPCQGKDAKGRATVDLQELCKSTGAGSEGEEAKIQGGKALAGESMDVLRLVDLGSVQFSGEAKGEGNHTLNGADGWLATDVLGPFKYGLAGAMVRSLKRMVLPK